MLGMDPLDTVRILKSLADETRLSVIRELVSQGSEVKSSDIITNCANSLRLSQPTMSHHLGTLVRSGVITERKSGTEKLYKINQQLLDQVGIDPTKL